MALKFKLLTRNAIRGLSHGDRLTEHGIEVSRLATGDVRYAINIMVDGARIHRVIGRESEGVTREQAERAIESLRTRAREERLELPKGRKVAPSFRDCAQDYLKRLSNEAGKGLARKAQHLAVRLVPAFGNHRINAIRESDVREFVRNRLEDGAKASTVNRELATLSHMLRSACRWGWLSRDRLPTFDRLAEGRGRTIALSVDACKALLAASAEDEDDDLWLFVLICLQTGMRHGEARRLRWANFDAARRRFFIPEAKAGQREQPLPGQLANVLAAERERRGATTEYLFGPGAGSKTEYRHTFRKAFRRAVARAGLDPNEVTPHVMRHTAITRLVKAGIDLATIQKVSGHKTLSMVMRYAHVDGAHVDAAVESLRFADDASIHQNYTQPREAGPNAISIA